MWPLLRLFAEGFHLVASRVVNAGGGVAELRDLFRERFPRVTLPHTNTFSALLNRIRVSGSIADRINRGIKPRVGSYPQVPRGYDCEGFLYRVFVPVIVPEYGSAGRTRTVRMPLEIESATNLNINQIQEMVPGAIEAMQGTRDNYELLRLGVAADRLDIGRVTVGDAYRC
jgi:hypothetical protein